MPTTLTHAVPAIAVGLGLGKDYISKRLIFTGAFIANIPDLDLIGSRYFHIPFDSVYGHRGYSHSIFFALVLAFIFSLFFLRSDFKKALLFLSFCTLSHGLLDAFTQGGLGTTFYWPFSDIRYHAFVQPIINVGVSFRSLYASRLGFPIFISEIIWVWIPFLLLGLALRMRFFSRLKSN